MIRFILYLFGYRPKEKYNIAWDEFLNKAIDDGRVELKGPHVALFAGVPVWVANFPYSSARPYEGPEVYPSKATIQRVQDAVVAAFILRGLGK